MCSQSTYIMEFCEHYVFEKQKRVNCKSPASHRTKGTLDYINVNFCGPSQSPLKGGVKYKLTFSDDYLGKVRVCFLKNKSGVFLIFKQWKVLIQVKQIKRLRTTNDLEFCNSEFNEFWKNEGIAQHHTVRMTLNKMVLQKESTELLRKELIALFQKSGWQKPFR